MQYVAGILLFRDNWMIWKVTREVRRCYRLRQNLCTIKSILNNRRGHLNREFRKFSLNSKLYLQPCMYGQLIQRHQIFPLAISNRRYNRIGHQEGWGQSWQRVFRKKKKTKSSLPIFAHFKKINCFLWELTKMFFIQRTLL